MRNRRHRLFTAALILVFVFSTILSGCKKTAEPSTDDTGNVSTDNGSTDSGNNNSSGNNSDSDNNSGSSDQNGSGSENEYNDPNFVGGHELTIYRVGDDTIAFTVAGDMTNQYESDYMFLEIRDDNDEPIAGASLNQFYSYVSRTIKEQSGDHYTVSFEDIEGLGGENGTHSVIGQKVFFVSMTAEGAWSRIPELKGNYELRRDEKILARGKVADVLKTVSAEDLAKVEESIHMNRTAQKPVEADWAGEYISGYGSVPSHLNIEVSETGIIHFHLLVRDTVYEWYGEETGFEATDYDGITYYYANSSVYEGYNNIAGFSLSTDGHNPEYANISMYSYMEGLDSINFTRFAGAWHTAPAGHEDKDLTGLLDESALDADCFKPVTDDYILSVHGGVSSGTYMGSQYVEASRVYELFSYDENRYAVQYVEKVELDSEEAAKAAYNKIVTNLDDYYKKIYKYYQQDKFVYQIQDVSTNFYYGKNAWLDSRFGDNWYLNCHYVKSDDFTDKYYYCAYMSKPFTEDEFSMSLEKMLYWKGMDYELDCIDDPNYYLRPEVNEYRTQFFVSTREYLDYDTPTMNGSVDNYVRYHEDGAEGVCVYYSDWEGYGKVYIHEYEFGKEEIKVTEYQYFFSEPGSCDVTINNYRDRTADATFTHTFKVAEKDLSNW